MSSVDLSQQKSGEVTAIRKVVGNDIIVSCLRLSRSKRGQFPLVEKN